MDINLLVNITSRAWSLAILAELSRGTPGRQAALMTATGAGRTAFAQSLAHLIELGLIVRNPGHGHPLRPEYLLSEQGKAIATTAEKIYGKGKEDGARSLLRRTWTVPILAVTAVPVSFSDIKRRLPPVTDRALSQSLISLQGAEWMNRAIDAEMRPPRASYQACGAGLMIGKTIERAIAL